jgi:hypothetical protein
MSIASMTVFSLPTSLTFEHYGLCRTITKVSTYIYFGNYLGQKTENNR